MPRVEADTPATTREALALVRNVAALVVTASALRVLGLRRTQALLDRAAATRRQARGPSVGASAEGVESVASQVAAAARLVRARCLTRSLVLQTILRRRGLDARLRIGVRRDSGQHRAHAWVEWQGHPLCETDDVARRFLPLEPHQGTPSKIDGDRGAQVKRSSSS